jgi:hypothetical protein
MGYPHWRQGKCRLNLYVFIILTNDLDASLALFKFEDDVTVIKINNPLDAGEMQRAINQVVGRLRDNFKDIDTNKKQFLTINNPPSPVFVGYYIDERATSIGLPGVIITTSLTWNELTTNVCAQINT